ncbi:hypothetical protein ACFLUV_07370, partial [Elusimicrobiota bacterium]
EVEKKKFDNFEEYLSSLKLTVNIHEDKKDIIPRIAQLTQKTNQFNLTTKRYSEADIKNFMEDPNVQVYAFSVEDRFGSYGITGLIITNLNEVKKECYIDTNLMSCRIIGRNLEGVFIDHVINRVKLQGYKSIRGEYVKTAKNKQVSNLYEEYGFRLAGEREDTKSYVLDLSSYKPKEIDYVEVRM